jgi:hypothetical protein
VGKLSARKVATVKAGRLVVAPSGAKKWVFCFSHGGRVTEMGLGSAAAVSLAEARDKAHHEARRALAARLNPIEVRRRARIAAAGKPTFGECAEEVIASKSSVWRSVRHRRQWLKALETYLKLIFPGSLQTLGSLTDTGSLHSHG